MVNRDFCYRDFCLSGFCYRDYGQSGFWLSGFWSIEIFAIGILVYQDFCIGILVIGILSIGVFVVLPFNCSQINWWWWGDLPLRAVQTACHFWLAVFRLGSEMSGGGFPLPSFASNVCERLAQGRTYESARYIAQSFPTLLHINTA